MITIHLHVSKLCVINFQRWYSMCTTSQQMQYGKLWPICFSNYQSIPELDLHIALNPSCTCALKRKRILELMHGNSDTYTWEDFRPIKQALARTCEFWTGWLTDSSLSPWDQKSGDKEKTNQFSFIEKYIYA